MPGQAPNLHLNGDGRAQAEALAKLLEKQPIAAIYSSHLERAIETAWRIAAPRGLPIHIRRTLADTDTGDYTARTIKEISEAEGSRDSWKVILEKPSLARLPNGESLLEMQARVVAELTRICAAYPDPEPPKEASGEHPDSGSSDTAKSAPPTQSSPPPEPPAPAIILVLMHADPIKAALAHFLGMPFDNFQRLGTSPASVSTVMVHGDQVMVMNINRTAQ